MSSSRSISAFTSAWVGISERSACSAGVRKGAFGSWSPGLYRLVSPIRVGQRLAGVGIDRCARATRCARRAVRAVALSLSRQKLGVLGAGRGLFRLLGGDDAVLARQVLVPLVLEQGLAGLALHGLALEQHAGHEIHLIGVGGQNRVGPIVGLLHDLGHLFIDATAVSSE